MKNEDYIKNLTSGARGGFARAIGEAWLRADSGNRAKIEDTWPNYFSVPLSRAELMQCRRITDAITLALKGIE